ncbi:WD40 repeat-like protein [Venturia nashicola]|nr:WD40 repeat-like protein [Venturia nashicola]
MAKRKREADAAVEAPNGKARKLSEATGPSKTIQIQVVTGSYERTLHGIIAAIPSSILKPAGAGAGADADADAVDKDTADKNGEDTADKNGEDTADKNGEDTVDKNGEDTADKNGEHTADKNGEHTADKNGEHTADKNGEHTADKNGEHTADKNGEHTADKNGEHTGDDPVSEEESLPDVRFSDSFLFNAHTSAIRCLALSPIPSDADSSTRIILASGSNDERINLYNISIAPPSISKSGRKVPVIPSLSSVPVASNTRNRELGSLIHHNGAITSLYFPTHSKLLSAAEDNNIAVARTKDGIVLTTIKAPVPKPVGRPSGDTAGPGEVPAGVNDFAVHPSMKLMLTVGKGERSMRLWNLVTGKKAGVLNFGRDMLQQVGEGKFGTGEGRRIIWDPTGEEFVIAFERGAVVYDIDCKLKSKIIPVPATKVHQMVYVPGSEENLVAVSTEDGRILFYDTKPSGAELTTANGEKVTKEKTIQEAILVAQLGGRAVGITTRIKDFQILAVDEQGSSTEIEGTFSYVIATGSSDGTIRIWSLLPEEVQVAIKLKAKQKETWRTTNSIPQVGRILAKYETGNRITCLKAFVMVGSGDDDGAETEAEEEKTEAESSDEDSD